MADLTDSQVVLDIQIAAKAAVWPTTEIETISGLADAQYDYEVEVLRQMALALAETPGDDQQAVYDAQVLAVDQALKFRQAAGTADFQSSCIGV